MPLSHDSLQPLAKLAESDRPVIFFDQLGCGQSDQPDDTSAWDMGFFVDQISAVREALNLNQVHLFGHSVGGMLSLEHTLAETASIKSLVLHSTPPSMELYINEWDRLESELPEEVQETLARHRAAGTMDDPAYLEAMQVFDHQHIWRLDPLPDYLQRALENLQVADIDIDEWDVRERLKDIRVPTLITSGRYDTVTPMLAEILHNGIAGSKWVLFEESSHYAHSEEPEYFLSVINDFLAQVEQ
jgi:proline-specific peptidase